MTEEDRKRADRIGVLSARLWRLEELLKVVGDETRRLGLKLGINTNVSQLADVVLRGVEAERLLASMIDEAKGELQALL